MQKWIEILLKTLILAAFVSPFLANFSYLYPYLSLKVFFLRAIIELMFGCYLILLLIDWERYKPTFDILAVSLCLLFSSMFLSSLLGLDFHYSFWDSQERMLGLFTIMHYFAFYLICSSVLKTWPDWQFLFRTVLVLGSVAMVVAIMRYFAKNEGRAIGTFGNPLYLASYGVFLIFISALLFIKENNKVVKWGALSLSGLAIICIFLSGSRGPLLALLISIFTILIFFVGKAGKITKWIVWSFLGVVCLLLALSVLYKNSNFVKDLPTIKRFADISADDARLKEWGIAIKAWRENPVLGLGHKSYFYSYNKFYNPYALESWADNAHNIMLNALAEGGIVGLFAYMAVFFSAVFVLYRAKKQGILDVKVFVICIGYLLAHFLKNLTLFEDSTSYVCLMFWLAFTSSVSSGEIRRKSRENKLARWSILPMAILCVVAVFHFNIQPAETCKLSVQTMKKLVKNNFALGLPLLKETLESPSPHKDHISYILGGVVDSCLNPANLKLIGHERGRELLEIVFPQLKANIDAHPLNVRHYLLVAELLGTLDFINNDRTGHLAERVGYLETALKLSPKRQKVIHLLAIAYIESGRKDEAEKILIEALNDNPTYSNNYFQLAQAYKMMGRSDKVNETLELAKTRGVYIDPIRIRKELTGK